MILNATSGYDFSEEEVKFVNLLARKADENKLVDILDLNELQREMVEGGIPANKLKELCKRMEDNYILKYNAMGGHTWITLNSSQVIGFKAQLKKISCPECHKRPLKKKTITYCPDCGYESNEV